MWFRRKYPIPFEAYRLRTPVNKKEPESLVHWAVLDLETTGFNLRNDRILSAAVTIVENGQFHMQSFQSWYVYQDLNEVNEATKIHGILPSQTEEGIPEKQLLETLISLLAGTVIVGHHILFDAAMLNIAMERHFSIPLRNQLLDTAYFASKELEAFRRTGYANQKPPSMEDVCAHLNVPIAERHTAEGDIFTTAQIFLILRGRLKRRLKRDLLLRDFPLTKTGASSKFKIGW
jgi:DNA polymerase-3 subunit epsilon